MRAISDKGKSPEEIRRPGSPKRICPKHQIFPGSNVITIVPFPLAGMLKKNGREMFEEFSFQQGDLIEYYPLVIEGVFAWDLKTAEDGSLAVVSVKHEQPGQFRLNTPIVWRKKWFLAQNIEWEACPAEACRMQEQELKQKLQAKGIMAGIKTGYWEKILAVNGTGEVVVAEQIDPVPPVHARLVDYLDEIRSLDSLDDKINFFAPKIIVFQENQIIAKKIPGKAGVAGQNIFGKAIPAEEMRDFELKAKRNVYLTNDGLEIRASCPGAPRKIDNYTYALEKVFVVAKDVDINTGSIEFPGDVIIRRDVLDGLYVSSTGKINIGGIMSGASLKAENGIMISGNVFNSKIILGERHYIRCHFLKKLRILEQYLTSLLHTAEKILNKNTNRKITFYALLKTLLETKYALIPAICTELNHLKKSEDEAFFTREIIVALHTILYFMDRRCLTDYQDKHYLTAALQEIRNFLGAKDSLCWEKAMLVAGYVQNSVINCAGDFICRKDAYNAKIDVEGDIGIYGVCRASLLSAQKIYVYELGSIAGDDVIINLSETGSLKADYCHPNIRILIGNRSVALEQAAFKLDVYMEKGKVIIDKLKWRGGH